MLMRWGGDHREDATILSVRSDGLGKFSPGFDRCGRALWVIPQRLRTPNGRGERAHSDFSNRERPQQSGTGHSRLSLLWRVLALDVSAPSARKYTKCHQNGEKFQSLIFKNSRNYFFLITNLNHPKNSCPRSHMDSALATHTYRGHTRAILLSPDTALRSFGG